jgi:hypothetical protein
MSRLVHVFFNDAHQARFTLRVVGDGDRYGREMALTHDDRDPLVEFYDLRWDHVRDPEGVVLGQFVSRYRLSTLLEPGRDGRTVFETGLTLDGGNAWRVGPEGMAACLVALREAGILPDPEREAALLARDVAESREKGWLLGISAIPADGVAVPAGMTAARLAPVHPERDAPDADRAFWALVDAELHRESRLESGLRIFDESEVARIGFDPSDPPEGAPLTPQEAYDIASSWGSYMRDGDPGAIFYSFPCGDARPQDAEHRLGLIRYTQSCQRIAEERLREFEAAQEAKRKDWPWSDPAEDLEDLKRLEVFFATSEAAPSREMLAEPPEEILLDI